MQAVLLGNYMCPNCGGIMINTYDNRTECVNDKCKEYKVLYYLPTIELKPVELADEKIIP